MMVYFASKHIMSASRKECEAKTTLMDHQSIRAYVEVEELEAVNIELRKALEENFQLKKRLKDLGKL